MWFYQNDHTFTGVSVKWRQRLRNSIFLSHMPVWSGRRSSSDGPFACSRRLWTLVFAVPLPSMLRFSQGRWTLLHGPYNQPSDLCGSSTGQPFTWVQSPGHWSPSWEMEMSYMISWSITRESVCGSWPLERYGENALILQPVLQALINFTTITGK